MFNRHKILNIIEIIFGTKIDVPLNECNAKTVEKRDSLNILNLIVALEDEFDIEITADEINYIIISGENLYKIIFSKAN